jgi:ABC-2 type transport system ATP-binding protein
METLHLLGRVQGRVDPTYRDELIERFAFDPSKFLSSHILSEVEALCDPVAILRSGHLVEVGTLADLRHLSALSVEATFTQPPPDLSAVPGVSDIEVDGNRVRLRVHGSVEPLLQRLTAARVTQLLSREPSLEELFLAQYGAEPAAMIREVTPSGR